MSNRSTPSTKDMCLESRVDSDWLFRLHAPTFSFQFFVLPGFQELNRLEPCLQGAQELEARIVQLHAYIGLLRVKAGFDAWGCQSPTFVVGGFLDPAADERSTLQNSRLTHNTKAQVHPQDLEPTATLPSRHRALGHEGIGGHPFASRRFCTNARPLSSGS